MIGATNLPSSSYASSIDEARTLVRRCAEPRPAGDQVKAAIFRASQRLDLPFSRVRDIWYGDARRIDADEMDQLRREAEKAELAQAVAAIEFLKTKLWRQLLIRRLRTYVQLCSLFNAIRRTGLVALDKRPKANLELLWPTRAPSTRGAGERCGFSRNEPYANRPLSAAKDSIAENNLICTLPN
jgi:hypothetical protein